jgi:hypothetical protein
MQTSSLSLQPHASRSSITMPYPSHLITSIAHSQIKHTIIQADVKLFYLTYLYNIDTIPRQKEDHHEVDSSFDAHRLSTLCRYPVPSIFSSGLQKTASQLLNEEFAHLISLIIPVTSSRSHVSPIELLFGPTLLGIPTVRINPKHTYLGDSRWDTYLQNTMVSGFKITSLRCKKYNLDFDSVLQTTSGLYITGRRATPQSLQTTLSTITPCTYSIYLPSKHN